jgi:hypothetical protein
MYEFYFHFPGSLGYVGPVGFERNLSECGPGIWLNFGSVAISVFSGVKIAMADAKGSQLEKKMRIKIANIFFMFPSLLYSLATVFY